MPDPFSSVAADSRGCAPLPAELDPSALFTLMIGFMEHLRVVVLDTNGRVAWCCPRCPAAVGLPDTGALVGRALASATPPDWAAERVAATVQACRESRALTLLAIVGGQRVLTRVLPIRQGPGPATRALLLIEPTTPDAVDRLLAARSDDVLWSRVHDLGPLDALTARELEILALLGRGLRTRDIAEALGRSVSTIDGHRERMGQKLGISDRAELVSVARRAGLRVEDADGLRVRLRRGPTRAPALRPQAG